MKFLLFLFFLFFLTFRTSSGESFIRSIQDAEPGSAYRIVATPDGGWAVFSLDKFKLYKFNSCGLLEWSKKYVVPSLTWTSNDFIRLQSGGFAFMTRVLTGNVYSTLMIRVDANGNIIWSKTFGDSFYDHYPYTISEDPQGNLWIWANVSHFSSSPYHNMICKITATGNIAWTRFYDHGGTWGGAIITSDNGMLARTGNLFFKTDASGNVQWTAAFSIPSTYNYLAPVEVSDGYIFTSTATPGELVNFHKINKQGQLVWTQYKKTNYGGLPRVLRKKSNGNFTCAFYRNITEFDKDLNVISQSALQPGLNLYGRDLCFLSDGSCAVTGNSNVGFFIAKTDAQYQTNCDSLPIQLAVTAGSMSELSRTTSGFNYTLYATDHATPVDTVSVSLASVCTSPHVLNLGIDTSVCDSKPLLLQNISGETFDRYRWSTGDTTPSLAVNQPGLYTLVAYFNCGLDSVSDSLTIDFLESPQADLGDDFYLCPDSTFVLTAPACSPCTYNWSTGITSDHISITSPGSYWIQVTHDNGCSASDTVEAREAACECSLFLPSAFTPNRDGRNEIFRPVYACDARDYNLKVFDRWGRLVFASDHPDTGWDGTKNNTSVMPGVYIYTVSYSPWLQGKEDAFVLKTGTVVVTY